MTQEEVKFGRTDVSDQTARDAYWASVTPDQMETVCFRKRSREACLRWLMQNLQTTDSMTEVGCGYSPFYDRLISTGYKGLFFGTDPVQSMIEENGRTKEHRDKTLWLVGTWQKILQEAARQVETVVFCNVHGSFPKAEALESIAAAFDVATKQVIVTNLDEAEFIAQRKGKTTHKFQAFTPEDYQSICPEGWTLKTELVGKRHRGASYVKEQ